MKLAQFIQSPDFNLKNFDFILLDFAHFKDFLRLNFIIKDLKLIAGGPQSPYFIIKFIVGVISFIGVIVDVIIIVIIRVGH